MIRCAMCGAAIKPWYEVCFDCYRLTTTKTAAIPKPIIAKDFMNEMGINGWK